MNDDKFYHEDNLCTTITIGKHKTIIHNFNKINNNND